MTVDVHDVNRYIFTFASIPCEATGTDNFFKKSKITPTFSSVSSLNGKVSRSKSNDRRFKIELTVLSTDVATQVAMRAIHSADILTPNGSGVAPLVISNMDSGEVWVFPEAWIIKEPDMEVKGEPDNRIIEFEAVAKIGG